MAWQTDSIAIIRNMIGDTDSENYEYSDERITQLFLVSASLVLFRTSFATDYNVDISGETITPDPSGDKDFMGLSCLKAACTLYNSELRYKYDSGKVSMKDGPSTISIDNSALLQSVGNSAKTICEQFEELLLSYMSVGPGGNVGVAILGPYSPGSNYTGNADYYDRNNFLN